jgi:hypothetical protein
MLAKLLFVVHFFAIICLFSQENSSVVGKVSDKELNDEPLLFATVQIKNTSEITQTNFHGNFEFKDVEPGNYTLVFSFLGYETSEIAIAVKEDEIFKINSLLKQKTIAFEASHDINSKTSENLNITTPLQKIAPLESVMQF